MRPFTYERVGDTASAAKALAANPDAKLIAGGTNLLDLMKHEIEKPAHLIDINRIGLDTIEPTSEGGLRIGALVRNTVLAADERIRRDYAVLSRALLAGASGQLRNKATTAGNLLQRTRCAYFYDTTTPCNKREPGSGCSALGGLSRNLALLGVSDDCIASHPSDMAVAMRVLDAKVETVNGEGRSRSIAIAEFHKLPGTTPQIDTVLEHGEIITAVILPRPVAGEHRYRKVRDRSSYAFATVSLASIKATDGGLRFAYGGLAPKPWRVEAAEAAIANGADAAADLALADARPTRQNAFKLTLARRLLAVAAA